MIEHSKMFPKKHKDEILKAALWCFRGIFRNLMHSSSKSWAIISSFLGKFKMWLANNFLKVKWDQLMDSVKTQEKSGDVS